MVVARTLVLASLMLALVWIDDLDTEEAALWTWRDPGAYEACVAAGGHPDHGDVLGRNAAMGPAGFPVGVASVWLDADGGSWQIPVYNWTYANSWRPLNGTEGLEEATGANIVLFDGYDAYFEEPWDWRTWFEAEPWQILERRFPFEYARSSPWSAEWYVPECRLGVGGNPLQQHQGGPVVWIAPDDHVQAQMYEAGNVNDAIHAMPAWYGDWREPHYERLTPLPGTLRPVPWNVISPTGSDPLPSHAPSTAVPQPPTRV